MNAEELEHSVSKFGVRYGSTDPVQAITDDGIIYSIVDVVREDVTTDGEGNVTSTGGTIWLKLEEA